MPGFFSNISTRFSNLPYGSSVSHRNAQRASGITQVLASSLQAMVSPAVIPAKFAQSMIAFYTVFREDTRRSEKGMLVLQGLMALTQLGLAITALYEKEDCYASNGTGNLCMTIILFDMIYAGTLSAIWALSELARDQITPIHPTTAPDPASNHP